MSQIGFRKSLVDGVRRRIARDTVIRIEFSVVGSDMNKCQQWSTHKSLRIVIDG